MAILLGEHPIVRSFHFLSPITSLDENSLAVYPVLLPAPQTDKPEMALLWQVSRWLRKLDLGMRSRRLNATCNGCRLGFWKQLRAHNSRSCQPLMPHASSLSRSWNGHMSLPNATFQAKTNEKQGCASRSVLGDATASGIDSKPAPPPKATDGTKQSTRHLTAASA